MVKFECKMSGISSDLTNPTNSEMWLRIINVLHVYEEIHHYCCFIKRVNYLKSLNAKLNRSNDLIPINSGFLSIYSHYCIGSLQKIVETCSNQKIL
ncbi:MAG: hypothetical protein ACTSRG_09410 [Candidatus Helarchaeota archaeon]